MGNQAPGSRLTGVASVPDFCSGASFKETFKEIVSGCRRPYCRQVATSQPPHHPSWGETTALGISGVAKWVQQRPKHLNSDEVHQDGLSDVHSVVHLSTEIVKSGLGSLPDFASNGANSA